MNHLQNKTPRFSRVSCLALPGNEAKNQGKSRLLKLAQGESRVFETFFYVQNNDHEKVGADRRAHLDTATVLQSRNVNGRARNPLRAAAPAGMRRRQAYGAPGGVPALPEALAADHYGSGIRQIPKSRFLQWKIKCKNTTESAKTGSIQLRLGFWPEPVTRRRL
jgi:hypothetical protein